MTIDFPAIQPTACSFTPPSWAITEAVAQSGVRSYRVWASQPSNAVLDLTFQNISETRAQAIMAAYTETRGPLDDLRIPDVVFNGIHDEAFRQLFSQQGTGLRWYFPFQDPPKLERVPGRRYTVKVVLRAELRF